MVQASNLDIERAIYHRFTEGENRKFAKVDLGQFPDVLKPGLNVAVTSGTFNLQSMSEYRQELAIVLLVAVKNVRSEIERRRLAHPLCEYAIRALASGDTPLVLVDDQFRPILENGKPQLLEMEEIVPAGWREATSPENFKNGETVFEVRFKTATSMSAGAIDTEDESDITEILTQYALLQKGDTMPTDPGTGPIPVIESTTTFEAEQGAP